MKMKENIQNCNTKELSLLVFNTQDLYNIRHTDMLFTAITARYVFTWKQLHKLIHDLEEDKQELLDEQNKFMGV